MGVTGTAGFICSHLALRLLACGDTVIGIDNLNNCYDPALNKARLTRFVDHKAFVDIRTDLADRAAMPKIFANAALRVGPPAKLL